MFSQVLEPLIKYLNDILCLSANIVIFVMIDCDIRTPAGTCKDDALDSYFYIGNIYFIMIVCFRCEHIHFFTKVITIKNNFQILKFKPLDKNNYLPNVLFTSLLIKFRDMSDILIHQVLFYHISLAFENLKTAETSWGWAVPSTGISLLACWGPVKFNSLIINLVFTGEDLN